MCKFNILGNIRIMFLLCLFRIFCIYTRLVFCISIQFFNTVVTLRNESRQILEFLMHFCSSSRYVMWQAFCSLRYPHIVASIFDVAFWFFQQQFFFTFQHRPALHLFQVSALFARFLLWFLKQFLGLCHVLNSSILNLCIAILYLWDVRYYICLVYFDICTTLIQQFLAVFNKNTSSKSVKYIC